MHAPRAIYSACFIFLILARTASRCRRGYILPLWFFLYFFLFSALNFWGHWTDLNQTWTHIHWWVLFEKFGPNFPGASCPPRAGGQKRFFLDWLLTLSEHISATEYDINNRKESFQSTGTPLHAAKFGELWSRNGWERFASLFPPPKFLHWETPLALTHGRYITDSRQTLARVV